MSVILRKRKNANGTTSLRLDIYTDGERKIETLKHLQLEKPTSILIREHNKKRLQQADEIRITRESQLQANDYNMATDAGKKTIIIDWMQSYVDGYTKKDKPNVQGVFNRFKGFLNDDTQKSPRLTFGELDALIIEAFIEYLEDRAIGEGALSYYNRFKKMIRHAYRKKLLIRNPFDDVEKKKWQKAKKKDILTLAEQKVLAATPTESSEVKRAFLFCCVTGLAFVDIKNLKWCNINLENRRLSTARSKTDVDVTMRLNDTAMKLLNEPGKKDDYVFTLPTPNGANKSLKAWVRRAGIDKAITWHNARHSFGTNLIFTKTDILTASKLLGHTSLKHTNRYVDSASEMKDTAVDKINIEL